MYQTVIIIRSCNAVALVLICNKNYVSSSVARWIRSLAFHWKRVEAEIINVRFHEELGQD